MHHRPDIASALKSAGGIAAVLSLLMAAGCATTDGKATPKAQAASATPTAAETLANSLNAKAAADRSQQGGYRDPLLRNTGGTQLAQSTTALDTPPPLPGSTGTGQAAIGGLVLQPTAVNANRSSIYSSAPSYPQATDPGAQPAAPAQPAAGGVRNIYSAPQAAPAVNPQAVVLPNNQSSENVPAASSAQTAVAQATPKLAASAASGAAAPEAEKARAISRMLASKGQDGAAVLGNSGFELTPGMVASLAQPPARRPMIRSGLFGLGQQPTGNTSLLQYASLPSSTNGALAGLELQTDQVQVGCFKPALNAKLKSVEAHFGKPVVVTSGYRDPAHNQMVGGSEESLHTHCDAADIQVPGVSKWEIAAYLRSLPNRGGVGTYCHTESVHVDTGSARDWNWGCNRS